MLSIFVIAFLAFEFVLSAKIPSPVLPGSTGATPVFRDECKDPSLNDCPADSICIDQFYGFLCQCKPGFVDQSPDKQENPGRVCVAAAGGAQNPDEPVTPASSNKKSHKGIQGKTTDPPKEEITKNPLIDQVARDAGTDSGPAVSPTPRHRSKGKSKTKSTDSGTGTGPAAPSSSETESETSKAGLKDTFNVFDSSKDGQINFNELKVATQNNNLRLADADVKAMLEKADTNGDGVVNFAEFSALMKGRRSSAS